MLTSWKFQPAGDIIEYYGVTESLLSHGGINLTQEDYQNLVNTFNEGYFSDPRYFMAGRGAERFSAHFIGYSVLAVPTRALLELIGSDPKKALGFTNLLIFSASLLFIMLKYLKNTAPKLILLLAAFTSPLIFFLTWPGPDLMVLSVLLISLFAFWKKDFITAVILAILASWHSQPLIVMAALYGLYWIVAEARSNIYMNFLKETIRIITTGKTIAIVTALTILAAIPYLYNLYFFSVLSPWSIFEDGWTKLNGFGIQNMSPWKLYEQLFDLNMGVFWYAPLLVVLATIVLWKLKFDRRIQFLTFGMILTAFAFQTNPAWHYGTAGFGPSRHAVFLIPFFIFLVVVGFQKIPKNMEMGLFGLSLLLFQWYSVSMNGYFVPDFTRVLYHNDYAKYVLNNYPELYNPTPEIFIDRSLHSDPQEPRSASYEHNGFCKKAYILSYDTDLIQKQCGFVPSKVENELWNLPKERSLEGIYVNY